MHTRGGSQQGLILTQHRPVFLSYKVIKFNAYMYKNLLDCLPASMVNRIKLMVCVFLEKRAVSYAWAAVGIERDQLYGF